MVADGGHPSRFVKKLPLGGVGPSIGHSGAAEVDNFGSACSGPLKKQHISLVRMAPSKAALLSVSRMAAVIRTMS